MSLQTIYLLAFITAWKINCLNQLGCSAGLTESPETMMAGKGIATTNDKRRAESIILDWCCLVLNVVSKFIQMLLAFKNPFKM